jgi:hypothetical protein
MGNSELFTKNRMWAFTTISIMCGDFEYEGQPDLKGIEDIILELIGGEMIYATVTNARCCGRPAIKIDFDSPALLDENRINAWKIAVARIVSRLGTILAGGSNCVHYSDGTSCSHNLD